MINIYMSEEEICKRYIRGKSRQSQIGILADLNATTPEIIREILIRNKIIEEPKQKTEVKKAV